MKQQVSIVFGAHPDDVEIGMGGTIKKLTDHGREVISCVAFIPNMPRQRKKETEHAAHILGIANVIYLNLPPRRFGFNRDTISAIDAVIAKYNPTSVFTHWIGDSHQDHVHLSHCVLAAARHNHFNVFMYEQTIPGGITHETFRAQLFVDISSQIEDKIKSILAHASQVVKYGDGWVGGVRGRAMHRGYQIKTAAAEAFEVIKIKEDIKIFSA